MKRNSYSTLVFAAVMALGLLATGLAMADEYTCPGYTPAPNSAVITPYIYGDCPASDYSAINNYPALIKIHDGDVGCMGWTNLHIWSFSEDGITKAAFQNCSHYRFAATVTFTNPTGEFGLRISPWWSPSVDGRFQVRATDGVVECWGGRLPYYNFTAAYGIHYVPGQAIWLQMTYDPNSLTAADPATIQYQVYYQGQGYSSPLLPFDQGNPAEPHGVYGELYPAYVGGFVQAPNGSGGAAWNYDITWENIQFEGPAATPAATSTWGQLKSLYR